VIAHPEPVYFVYFPGSGGRELKELLINSIYIRKHRKWIKLAPRAHA
jgi:hypothetical protein